MKLLVIPSLFLAIATGLLAQSPGIRFGGSKEDRGIEIKQTSDNHLVMVGFTWSFPEKSDVYVVKTDLKGNKVWETGIGSAANDYGFDIEETPTGDFLLTGWTDGFETGVDVMLMQISKDGKKLWQKNIPYPGDERAFSLEPVGNNEYIITGQTKNRTTKNYDGLVMRIKADGMVVWQKQVGGDTYDRLFYCKETNEGNILLVGIVRADSTAENSGWVVLLDGKGRELRSQKLSTIRNTTPHGVLKSGSDFLLVGYAQTDSTQNQRSPYVSKLDAKANQLWERTVNENASSTHTLSGAINASGQLMLTGYTKPIQAAEWQGVVYTLTPDAKLIDKREFGGAASDLPYTIRAIDSGVAIVGQTFSYGATEGDLWLILMDESGSFR